MSLAHGRQYLAIPGPSVMPDRVLAAMHRPAPNIYEGDLIEMTGALIPDLRAVARTRHHVAVYVANGHGAWEAALANVACRGDRVLVAATGRFAHGWAEMARGLGLDVQMEDFGQAAPIDPGRIEAALRADAGGRIRAVLACHVDTSTTVRNDVTALRAAIDAAGHPALLMVDCIASLACDRYEMDAWGADVTVSASQKGLMVPPGLGLVFFNDRAAEARRRADLATTYWDWTNRAAPERFYQYFGGTAPTHHLFGLREALDMIAEEGLEAVWARHEALARAIWAAVETWGQGGPMRLNIADAAYRSHAVTSIHLPDGQGERLRQWCASEAGVTLGIGLGREPADDYFRIGHMGHVNAHMVLGLLGVLEAGMEALGIARGGGALAAAAGVVGRRA